MTATYARRRATNLVAALAALMLVAALVVADAGAARADVSYSISGQVTLPADAPAEYLKAITVYVNKETGPFYTDTVKPSEVDGTYSISGLPPGTYKVIFQVGIYWNGASFETPNLVEVTYDGKYNAGYYTPVDLTVGDAVGIDAAVEWGSTISGTVTLAADAPSAWLAGVSVVADGDNGAHITTVVNGSTGDYTLANLPPGSYLVSFVNWQYVDGGSYVPTEFYPEYYNDVYTTDNATPVLVTSHSAVTAINAQLSRFAHFSSTPVPTLSYVSLKSGSIVTAKRGVWSPTPTTVKYQWYRNGTKITGATNYRYTLTTADRGTTLTVKVTGSRAGFNTTTMTSAGRAIPKVFITTQPTITGIASAGHTLKSHTATWTPSAVPFLYQWYRDGVKILGANMYWYKVTTADKGKKIVVAVTGQRSGYVKATRTSAPVTIAK